VHSITDHYILPPSFPLESLCLNCFVSLHFRSHPLIDFTQEYQFVNIICNFDFLKLVQSGLLSHDGARLIPSPQNFRCAIDTVNLSNILCHSEVNIEGTAYPPGATEFTPGF
jgi:hypothetical protein